MAKGNLILGFGRKKLGDVVLYRRNGQQCARARNRAPKNPNTYSQVVQRAVMATAMRMYSLGKAIFDHSFEGKQVTSGSQSEFMRRNLNILRKKVVTELNAVTAQEDGKVWVTARGLAIAVPNNYQISAGSYQNNFVSGEQIADGQGSVELPLPGEGMTISQYCTEHGLIADDIYTIVYLGINKDDIMFQAGEPSNAYATVYNSKFGYVQLRVKAEAIGDPTVMTGSTKWNAIFDVVATNDYAGDTEFNDVLIPADILGQDFAIAGCGGIIRSREDSGLRSTSYMYVWGDAFGLTTSWLVEGWTQDNKLNAASDLILEGANFPLG